MENYDSYVDGLNASIPPSINIYDHDVTSVVSTIATAGSASTTTTPNTISSGNLIEEIKTNATIIKNKLLDSFKSGNLHYTCEKSCKAEIEYNLNQTS